MTIRDWLDDNGVDHRGMKYVQPETKCVACRYGTFTIPRGFLADGDSRVLDLVPSAFFAHDLLYKLPVVHAVDADSTGCKRQMYRRLSQFQVDRVYGDLYAEQQLAFYKVVGWIRSRALWCTCVWPWNAWRNYRRQEAQADGWLEWEAEVMRRFVVPKSSLWRFPTIRLDDAEWIGA